MPPLGRRAAALCGCGVCLGGLALVLQRTDAYRRFEARALAPGGVMDEYEAALRERKAALFASIAPGSAVVELGLGAAPNLAFLPPGCRVTGVDPNERTQPYARAAAARAGVTSLDLVVGTAERLPLADASADAVVATLVFCSVADPAAALAEACRVLRPGGRFVFVEHVAAGWRKAPLLAAAQVALDPLQRAAAGGCHLRRDTGALFEAHAPAGAGGVGEGAARMADGGGAVLPLLFSALSVDRFRAPLSSAYSLIAPHVAGVGVRA